MSAFYGKYRAIVTNNKDPENMGRIKVRCPKVLGEYESAWCTPCVQSAFNDGGFFFVPSVKETVWVEFEEGNPSKPIWVGSWWIPNRTPLQDKNNVEEKIVLISRSQHIIEIDDKNNTLIVKMKDGSRLKLGEGLEITAPTGKKLAVFGDVEFNNKVKILGEVDIQNNVKVSSTLEAKTLKVTNSASVTNSLTAKTISATSSLSGGSISEGGSSLSSKYASKSEACKCS